MLGSQFGWDGAREVSVNAHGMCGVKSLRRRA